MSDSRNPRDVEAFILRMRDLGAHTVSVGDVTVAFELRDDEPGVDEAPLVEPTPEELKKKTEQLLYASSD